MNWQPPSYTADQHRRLTVEPAIIRREAEQQIAKMPLVVEKIAGTNAGDWICGLGLLAFVTAMVMA